MLHPENWPLPRREDVRAGAQVDVLERCVTPASGLVREIWRRGVVIEPPDLLLSIAVRFADGTTAVVNRRHWRRY